MACPKMLLVKMGPDTEYNDWQFLPSEFSTLIKQVSMHGRIDVDLFTCGRGAILKKSMCGVYRRKKVMLSNILGSELHSAGILGI